MSDNTSGTGVPPIPSPAQGGIPAAPGSAPAYNPSITYGWDRGQGGYQMQPPTSAPSETLAPGSTQGGPPPGYGGGGRQAGYGGPNMGGMPPGFRDNFQTGGMGGRKAGFGSGPGGASSGYGLQGSYSPQQFLQTYTGGMSPVQKVAFASLTPAQQQAQTMAAMAKTWNGADSSGVQHGYMTDVNGDGTNDFVGSRLYAQMYGAPNRPPAPSANFANWATAGGYGQSPVI